MNKINLLDCTLREAPIDNAILGQRSIQSFIHGLEKTNIDIIECGFLKNDEYIVGNTKFKTVEDISLYLQNKKTNKIYTALVDYGRYDLKYLSDYDGTSIDGIRICFKRGQQKEVIGYAQKIKQKGYKVFIQHVDSLDYTDIELLEFLNDINQLQPFSYSLVDTFGSMYADDLKRLFNLINHNLNKNVLLGYHAHNNLMLANSNTQEFIFLATSTNRAITIDASVLGCGRGAGNAHTELIAEFLNKKYSCNYNSDELLDIIDTLMPILKEKCVWGYSIPYFLSGTHSSHVFNVNHLLRRHNIKSKDLRMIIESLDDKQKKTYDFSLLERLYVEHFNKEIDDRDNRSELRKIFDKKKLLLLATGNSIKKEKRIISEFIEKENPIVIGLNDIIALYKLDFVFFSSINRYYANLDNHKKSDFKEIKLIITSNIKTEKESSEILINYLSLIRYGWINIDNSAMLILRLLIDLNVKDISIAGLDGFSDFSKNDYYDDSLRTNTDREDLLILTKEIKEMFSELKETTKQRNININFLTQSLYQECFK
jgi:4-hydroxy 2-oxovalerate aldolase